MADVLVAATAGDALVGEQLGGERVFPEITPEVIAKVQERINNPGKTLTVDQFLRRLDRLIQARRALAESESVR